MPAPPLPDPALSRLAIDAVRVLSMDAVQKANSGHPGAPMGLAPVGYLLWTRHLSHNPANPEWSDRDRFVLSAGHASMLVYSLLHLSGYDLPLEEIRNFRQWGSRTPGHPEHGHTAGVETTTGPLGQGVANSVGMALAERWLAHRFNRPGHEVVDHHTWALCSDGDLMEGISHEAAEFAAHQRLGKLIWVFDDNRVTIDGGTDLSCSTDHERRFRAYGWDVRRVRDGNDLPALDAALAGAREEAGRPSLVIVRTTIGYGSPGKAGSSSSHGAPLGVEEVDATKRNLGYPSRDPFHVEAEALAHWRETAGRGAELEEEWRGRRAAYRAAHPAAAEELRAALAGEPPAGWDAEIPDLAAPPKPLATRVCSGQVLRGLGKRVPNLLGGSADLAGSNKTTLAGADNLLAATPGGRTIHFGVREHAMGGILNGMALHGGVRPYGGTFLIFSDYMRPSIRLAALMRLPVTYVFTHDSIGVGEDGPTHQPIEQLASLRAIPGVLDLRPADGPETAEAWRAALTYADGPSFLALTRQAVAIIDRDETASQARGMGPTGGVGRLPHSDADRTGGSSGRNEATSSGRCRATPASGLHRGGYVLLEATGGDPAAILIASGSEVGVAIEARTALQAEGVPTRVVSLPSWFLFSRQPRRYRDQVLPPEVPARVSVEAGSTAGWTRWTGDRGGSVGIDHFGASAPGAVLFEKFGITAEAVVAKARGLAKGAAAGSGPGNPIPGGG